MDTSSIAQLLISSLPSKLIVTLCLTLVFLYTRKRDTEGVSSGFLYLFGLQAFRDLLYFFLPVPEIYLLSDIFLLVSMDISRPLP